MKTLVLLLLSLSSTVFADVCICQFPKEDSKFGSGYQGEIGFYKLGCAAWLASELGCRKEKIVDINLSLVPYLDEVLKPEEKIRLGYVGHWGSSRELVEYLDTDVTPLLLKYQVPITVDNTACYAMEDAKHVQNYLNGIGADQKIHLRVKGNQTTSIGMWDKLTIGFRHTDLEAYASSTKDQKLYPSCSAYLGRRCTGFQTLETGFCLDEDGQERELICHGRIKKKVNNRLKLKKFKRWFYKEDISNLSVELKVQEFSDTVTPEKLP